MAGNNTGGSFLDKLLGGIKFILRNGFELPQRSKLNFIGFPAVLDNPSLGTTDVYGTSGSTGGGITIIENNGAAMPTEPALNFVGFVLGDDPGNSRTNVALPSPGTTAVANGGTGRTSLTSHAVLLGEGSSPIGFAVPTSSGFVLTDQGPGADPVFASPPSGLPAGTGIVEVTSGVGGVLAIPLDVPHGGTGDVALTSHAILLGRGTSSVGFVTPTSSGFVLLDHGPGADPSFGPAPGGFPTPTSTDTSLTFDPSAFPISPNLGWSSKRGVNNVRSFGAVGDDVHDDTTAINNALTAASANGLPVYFPSPTVAYKITAPILAPIGVSLFGDAAEEGETPIRAHGAISAVLEVHTTGLMGGSVVYASPNVIQGLTLDANGQADYALLRLGSFLCTFRRVFCMNAKKNARMSVAHRLPMLLSAVTPGGGNTSPALTVAVRDPFWGPLDAGVYHIVLKVAPGATTYIVSVDNGVSFSVGAFPIGAGAHNIPYIAAGVSNISFDLGVQGTWAAGAFAAGDTWAFTVTVQTEDSGLAYAIQGDTIWENCWGSHSGAIFATAALTAPYSGLANSVTTVAGTVATTSFTSLVVGTGTSFISTGARPGDVLRIPNGSATQTDRFWQIVCVLDDQNIIVDGLIPYTVSGLDYAIGLGGDYTEMDEVEQVRAHATDGFSHHVPIGLRFSGSQGPYSEIQHTEYCAFTGLILGGTVVSMINVQLNAYHSEVNGAFAADGISALVSTKVVGGEFSNPLENFSVGMRGQTFVSQGSLKSGIGVGTQVPTFAMAYLQQSVTLATLGDTLPVPTTQSLTNTVTTLQVLHLPSSGVLTAVVPLADLDGTRVIYRVYAATSHVAVFVDNAIQGNKLALEAPYVAVGPGEEIEFEQYLGRWWQRGPVRRNWFGIGALASGDGPGENFIITTNATPTFAYQFFIGTNTNRIANIVEFDILASTTDGSVVGLWEGVRARYAGGKSAGNGGQIGVVTTEYETGTDPGDVPPAGWGFSLTSPGAQLINLNVIGQAATTIHWRVKYRPRTMPLFT